MKKGEILYTAFDQFSIIKQIGAGGNGKVYEAVNSSNEHVAIKVIDISALGRDKLKRFKNEIYFCQGKKHNNIIEVIDSGRDSSGQYAFYVMPLYNTTLRERINEGIQPEDAIEIIDSLLAGLDYSHQNNIYHRDIKPENIFFDAHSNKCVIGDFGIAHFPAEEMQTLVETKVKDRMANFQYAAPEQRAKGNKVDGRADVFAVGLILNEMLTGQLIGASGYKKIADVYPDYSFLDEIVERLYQQDPDNRLFPASKIRNELRARFEMAQSDAKVRQLEKTLREKKNDPNEYIELSVPEIDAATIDGNKLVFKMKSKVPSEWFVVFTNGSYVHTAVVGYGPEHFHLYNGNEISIQLGSLDNQNTIQQVVSYFKEWLPQVTSLYNAQRKREYERKKNEEIENIKRDIEMREKNKSLNEFVQSLI